jgi:hypothetical protein
MYFPDVEFSARTGRKKRHILEELLIPRNIRESFFGYDYGAFLEGAETDGQAVQAFREKFLASEPELRKIAEMVEFGVTRLVDSKHLREYLEYAQHFLWNRYDPDYAGYLTDEIQGLKQKYHAFTAELSDRYSIRYDFYEFMDYRQGYFYFIDPYFIDRSDGKSYQMHECFPPRILDLLYAYQFRSYRFGGHMQGADIISSRYANPAERKIFQKNIDVAVEWFGRFG